MKAKWITVAMGALLLGTGTLAMANDGRDRDDGWRRHESRDREWRKPEWREDHAPRSHREYYRYEPRYVPAPHWRDRSAYPYSPGYDRDGASIILRGRIN